jgi:hypothetical protein
MQNGIPAAESKNSSWQPVLGIQKVPESNVSSYFNSPDYGFRPTDNSLLLNAVIAFSIQIKITSFQVQIYS